MSILVHQPEEFQWVKHGVPVWYHPSIGIARRYAATVDGHPQLLGGHDGSWVVRLVDVEPAYRNGHGTVKAAYLGALTPREEEATFHWNNGRDLLKTFRHGSDGGVRDATAQDIVDAISAAPVAVRKSILSAVIAASIDDPEFGVDPEDSQALLKLRRTLDDVLLWPNDIAKNRGDYEIAIRHTAYLARVFETVSSSLYAIQEADLP